MYVHSLSVDTLSEFLSFLLFFTNYQKLKANIYSLSSLLHVFAWNIYFGSKIDDSHILRKLKPQDIWHLTVLGSLATTQREYVALHAFSRLNPQVGFCLFSYRSPIGALKYADVGET